MKKINLSFYTKICFCGIGGSAVPGEIINSLNLKKPILLTREKLPSSVNSKTLCFIISYSGNTKETINLYNQAKKKKAKTVIITSGGKLGKNKDSILIPKGYLPRQALVYLLLPVLDILNIKGDVLKPLKKINSLKAKYIARKIKNKLPLIYASSENLKVVSWRWETQFNENAKTLAHSDYFPAISHNEIEAKLNKDARVILLLDKQTTPIKKAKKYLNPLIVKLKGDTLLEKILYGIYFGDLVSFYLAEFKGVDFRHVKRIESLKR